MAQLVSDLAYSILHCLCCFPSTPHLKINNRSFKILRLLGEGGFSYVYLVQEISSGALYALKKIRCPFGRESVERALREVEAYALFDGHPNIIPCIEHSVVSSSTASSSARRGGNVADSDGGDGGDKTVYILLPYYSRGNLQDAINANLVNHTRFEERRLLGLFRGVATGLKAMHQYRRAARRNAHRPTPASAPDADAEQHEPLMRATGDDGDDVQAYAHRDIKPGNIMISPDGATPIVMDLGSLMPSPTVITSRAAALAAQDLAAEHSTMPYRAPELFDVQTGAVLDTAVDVWALGCALYACCVGKSPFEARCDETGGSLAMCVLSGDWRWPDEGKDRGKAKGGDNAQGKDQGKAGDGAVSEPVKRVVRACLRLDPAERPDVDALIDLIDRAVEELPEEDGDRGREGE